MNIYLISSESFRLMQEEVNKITQNSTNIMIFDLLVNSLEDIINEAIYVSMFAEQKYLIVKNAEMFTSAKTSEAEIELLTKYLTNPVSLTTIIFETYNKLDMRKKITKLVNDKYKIINIPNLNRIDLTNKIRGYVTQNGYKIDTETINYIIEACYNNYDLIINELDKTFLYYDKDATFQLKDIENIISRSLVDNNFKFVEAVIKKDLVLAEKILNDLYTIKVEPINLLMLLAREYRLMFCVKNLTNQGSSKKAIAQKLHLQDWQVEKTYTNSLSYPEKDLLNYLAKIADLDYLIKSGQTDRFIALKLFLLDID